MSYTTRAFFEKVGDTIQLVFRSKRNKEASIQFAGDNIVSRVNNSIISTLDSSGLAVSGTLTTTGALTTSGALTTTGNITNVGNLVSDGLSLQSGVVEKTAAVTLTVTEIVGTAAGDIGHASGATLVAAPGAGYALELVSAVLIYDYDTAAYTGGGDDTVIQNGDTATALTAAIAGADLLEASGDKIVQINALAASDQALVANKPLSLQGTALTQPGTAAGVLRCNVTYKVHTTGL